MKKSDLTLLLSALVSFVASPLACASHDAGGEGSSTGSLASNLSPTKGAPVVGLASKCLDDHFDESANGTAIDLFACNGTAAQDWSYQGGQLVGPAGKCLDIVSDNQTPGTHVDLYTCNGTSAQQWTIEGKTLVSTKGYCLDVAGDVSANGTVIDIFTCNGGSNQEWSVESVTGSGSGSGSSAGSGSGSGGGSDKLLGCYADKSDRELPDLIYSGSDNTTGRCVAACKSAGYAYAGTEWSVQCFCGDSYGSHGSASDCTMACSGDASEICGGGWATSVYATGVEKGTGLGSGSGSHSGSGSGSGSGRGSGSGSGTGSGSGGGGSSETTVNAAPTGPQTPSGGWSVVLADAFVGSINATGTGQDTFWADPPTGPSQGSDPVYFNPSQVSTGAGGLKLTAEPWSGGSKPFQSGNLQSATTDGKSLFSFWPDGASTLSFELVFTAPLNGIGTEDGNDPSFWAWDIPHWTDEIDFFEYWGGGANLTNLDQTLATTPTWIYDTSTVANQSAYKNQPQFYDGEQHRLTEVIYPSRTMSTWMDGVFQTWVGDDGVLAAPPSTTDAPLNLILQFGMRLTDWGSGEAPTWTTPRVYSVRSCAVYQDTPHKGDHIVGGGIAYGTTVAP